MIHTANPAVNVSLLGSLKTVLVIGMGVFAFIEINPLSSKVGTGVTVSADSYPFVIPKALKDGYMGENTQVLLARSVWEFRIKNDGPKALTNIALEFPFSGSYTVQATNAPIRDGIPTFARRIALDNLEAGQDARVTIWAGEEINPEFERMIKVRSGEGVLSVDYPVKASGLIAWVERYKTPLSLGLFILFLVTVL